MCQLFERGHCVPKPLHPPCVTLALLASPCPAAPTDAEGDARRAAGDEQQSCRDAGACARRRGQALHGGRVCRQLSMPGSRWNRFSVVEEAAGRFYSSLFIATALDHRVKLGRSTAFTPSHRALLASLGSWLSDGRMASINSLEESAAPGPES